MYQFVATFTVPEARSTFFVNYIRSTGQLLNAHIDYSEDDHSIGMWKNSASKEELEQIAQFVRVIGKYAGVHSVGSIQPIPDPAN